jgi:predicted RND superfamily exporter protein
MGIRQAAIEGAKLRFRPVAMTATVAALGLLPFLFETGPGSEVQRPLAIVVIGGLISSTLLTLIVVPTFYGFFESKSERHQADSHHNPSTQAATMEPLENSSLQHDLARFVKTLEHPRPVRMNSCTGGVSWCFK